jgi:hypothetical protein
MNATSLSVVRRTVQERTAHPLDVDENGGQLEARHGDRSTAIQDLM